MIERIAWALVWLFVFTIPWEKTLYIAGIGTGTRVLGAAAVAAGAIAALYRRNLRRPNLPLVIAAVFMLWTALTWFWSYDPPATAARAFTFVQLAAMAYLVWDQCRTAERQTQLAVAYVSGAAVASVATIVRYVQGLQTYYRRYAAAGFDPNDLALTVALAIPLALYLALRARGWRAWLYRGAVALISVAILLSASRTALIAAFAAFAFVVFTWRQSQNTQRMAGVALAVLLLLGTVKLAPSAARERIATLGAEVSSGTLHGRTRIWKTGLKAFKQRPIRGVGSGAYPEAVRPWLGVPAIAGHEYVAHNTFLSVLVESGLIGFGLYVLLLLTITAFVYMLPAPERPLWATMLVVWAIGVSTLTWEHRKPTWLIFALVMTAWARAFAPDPEEVPR